MFFTPTQNPHSVRRRQAAFTLLEVILALAILAGAVAVLGEVMELARRNAMDCEAETQAQILASTLLDEIAVGLTDLTEVDRDPVDTETAVPWVYSVSIKDIDEDTNTDIEGLVAVEVLVEQDIEKRLRPMKYRLVRWFDSDKVDDRSEESTEETETP